MAKKKQDKGKGVGYTEQEAEKQKGRQSEIVPVQWDQIFSI